MLEIVYCGSREYLRPENKHTEHVLCFKIVLPETFGLNLSPYSNDSITQSQLRMRLNVFGRNFGWNCTQCPRTKIHDAQRRALSTPGQPIRLFDKKRKERAVQLAAAGSALTVSAALLSDEIKHGYNAVERTARVMSTLAVCVNEYILKSSSSFMCTDPVVAAIARLSTCNAMTPTKKQYF